MIKKLWLKPARKIFIKVFPKVEPYKIDEFLDRVFKRDFKDNEAILYNSYELSFAKTKLSYVVEFMEKEKPIITENGTLYRTHKQTSDPMGDYYNPMKIIVEGWLQDRYKLKKKMLEYKGVPGKETLFEYYNLGQLSKKTLANGDYGAGGNLYYQMFDANSANAITAKARALISTTLTTTENFFRGNVPFFNTDELFEYFEFILNEKYTSDINTIINKNISIDDVIVRYSNTFYDDTLFEEKIIRRYLKTLNKTDLKKLYFKNNYLEFTDLPYLQELMKNIFYSVDKFENPYDVSDKMKPYLDEFISITLDIVHYNNILFDKQWRMDKGRRKVGVVLDTDSIMISFRQFMERMWDMLNIDKNDIGAMSPIRFKTSNILAALTTEMLNNTMDSFNIINSNVDDDAPGVCKIALDFLIAGNC